MSNSELKSIAALLTCHNRKDKTIRCIQHLYDSSTNCSTNFQMDVYLTDDGSEDGTAEAVEELFPEVIILPGNGNLFWTGGMINSWNEAIKRKYNGYLLLNDDTFVYESCFEQLFRTHDYALSFYNRPGIYVGSVADPKTGEFTFGGRTIINRWSYKQKKLIPNGSIRTCQLSNANIMFVHSEVVEILGVLNSKYVHRTADYDYSLRAVRIGIPVLVCPDYCGTCTFDRISPDLNKMPLNKRIQYLKSPKGMAISGYMYYQRKFFPWRVPFVFITLWLRILIPGTAVFIDRAMKRK